MSDIIGNIYQGYAANQAGNAASNKALTGFNYLNNSPAETGYINNGSGANNAEANLLGLNGAAGNAQSSPAFQNYLNSTGYQFQLGQGTQAIANGAASKGLLNSGATAKALTQYGQGLAGQSFNNYLNQVNGVSQQGQTALGQVGQAGTQGGSTAAQAIFAGQNASAQAYGKAGSGILSMFGI